MIRSNGIHPIQMDWGALATCVESREVEHVSGGTRIADYRLLICMGYLQIVQFQVCLLWYLENIILHDVTGQTNTR